MPNTLIHLGVQGMLNRALVPAVDLRMVFLGCLLPDLPWIAQRALRVLAPGIDRIDLLVYCGIQASLAYCLLLAVVVALPARRPAAMFAVLAGGAVTHLALDMVQVKWGRGVSWWAPLDWRLSSFDLLWPEHWLFTLVLIASVGFCLASWRSIPDQPLFGRRAWRYLLAAGALAVYLSTPPLFVANAVAANLYDVATLREAGMRSGRAATFDRESLVIDDGRLALRIFTGEVIAIHGVEGAAGGLLSARGRFRDDGSFSVEAYHRHPGYRRAAASVAGIAVVLAALVLPWWRRRTRASG